MECVDHQNVTTYSALDTVWHGLCCLLQGGEGGEAREVLARQTSGPVRVATLLKTPEEGALGPVLVGTSGASDACIHICHYVCGLCSHTAHCRGTGLVCGGVGVWRSHEVDLE